MQTIEKTIEVERPVSDVYGQWARFQDFPQYMKGIKAVRLIGDRHVRLKAAIGGRTAEWDAEIIEQVPDQRISWQSTSGAENSGTMTFVSLTSSKTRVILYLSYDPKGIFENLGANIGLVSARVTGDLGCFKKFIESRAAPVRGGHIAAMPVPAGP